LKKNQLKSESPLRPFLEASRGFFVLDELGHEWQLVQDKKQGRFFWPSIARLHFIPQGIRCKKNDFSLFSNSVIPQKIENYIRV
jgi:hypothetical protein